ncbi:MAG: hypothetical protein PHP45_09950 [Elusimicrobiales bacterium]|nr:hypothetical protein [Elusimicrobiales bacterium]
MLKLLKCMCAVFVFLIPAGAAGAAENNPGNASATSLADAQPYQTAPGGEWFGQILVMDDLKAFAVFLEEKGGKVSGEGRLARFFLDTPEREINTKSDVDLLVKEFSQWKGKLFNARSTSANDMEKISGGFPVSDTKCVSPGTHCTHTYECCDSSVCRDKHYCSPGTGCFQPGTPCDYSADCCGSSRCDGYCDAGKGFAKSGEKCASSIDCYGSSFCQNHQCA